ncbi:cofactor-independent phosphoglycerate mutase [Desulfonatronospira sp.]|uniref:cofactor-independent phosphoglycerate mutase n=1 Tax=Desulfonatronospira sp. TaxID=1962951 RepID=UPI0025BB5F6E|nr:cofactor-independent phosphoglycerate mutase [Desulfonatronospira sp.]
MTKVLLLVGDGMGDWPLQELGGKTPLEEAYTPALDFLAPLSRVGLCQTIPADMPPGSDIANMTLLGYDPHEFHTGRGPIEAVAMGLETAEDDLVWRCNLVDVSEFSSSGTMLDYAAGHIGSREGAELMQGLQKELGDSEFSFHAGVQYRHILVQKKGIPGRAAGLDITPPHDLLDQSLAGDLEKYKGYPALWDLVSSAARFLQSSGNRTRARAIWPWGQGGALKLPSFKSRYSLEGAVISAVDLVKGLGRAAGMRVVDVPGATGLLETNYQGKLHAAKAFLESGDFVFVHLEAPDECGHMGCIQDKVEAISRFDQQIVLPLLEHLRGEEVIIIACCDHLTPIKIRTHARDPVPFLVYDSREKASGPETFSEKEAGKTGLFLKQGHDLLPFALNKKGVK